MFYRITLFACRILGIYIELSSMVMLILAKFNGIKQRENNNDPLVSDMVHLRYAKKVWFRLMFMVN
jgi:hypothetical protein